MTNFWIGWYGDHGPFELHWPWWISGHEVRGETETPTFCAAVRAKDEEGAKRLVVEALDEPAEFRWRFVEPQPDDWSPYNGRFPKADWMPEWPPQ